MSTHYHHNITTTNNAGGSSRTLQAPPSSSGEFPFDAVKFVREALILGVVALVALMATAPAKADDSLARVVSIAPLRQTIDQPQRVCEQMPGQVQYQYPQQPQGNGGAVLGAITGGLIGKTVGRGQGRVAAAAIGAATGAIVGDRMQNNGGGQPQQVYVPGGVSCYTTHNYIERENGAVVVFELHGRTYSQQLSYVPQYQPGDRVPVSLNPRLQ